MRFVRVLVVAALVGSLAMNFFLYMRQAGRRVQMTVGGTTLNVRSYQNFLNERYGIEVLSRIARYELVRNAIKKSKVKLDKTEVDEALKEVQEQKPAVAQEFKFRPYRKTDTRDELEYVLGMSALRTLDVQATPDEVKDFFGSAQGRYNKPDKVYTKVFQVQDTATADKAKELMSNVTDMKLVQTQLDPKGKTASMAGVDGTMVFAKPVGKPSNQAIINQIAAMKDGTVRVFGSGNTFLVVKRERMEQGKVVTLDDVRAKVERDYKLTRALPEREVLRKLWDEAKVATDDPEQVKQVKWNVFRDPNDL